MSRLHAAAALVLGFAVTTSAAEFFVYFGTYTSGQSEGIYRSRFDSSTGKLSEPSLAAKIQNPSFLALHPQTNFLYAAGEMDSGGSVTAFSLDPTSGELIRLNTESSQGRGPCHLSVDHSGRFVFVANYGGGSIAALPIRANGGVAAATASIQHRGGSAHPRQAAPHAHFISPSPDNRFALVCDLGLDQVLSYTIDDSKGLAMEPRAAKLPAGSGPRHLEFAPNGKFAYVVNELNGTVGVFSYHAETAQLGEAQTISSLPDGYTNQNTSAGIAVHPSGKFVYASNRGHDSIAVFEVAADSGQLRFVAHERRGVRTPRHFAVDPTGRWMLVENQAAGSVLVFGIDLETGKLNASGESISVASPVCAVFAAVNK